MSSFEEITKKGGQKENLPAHQKLFYHKTSTPVNNSAQNGETINFLYIFIKIIIFFREKLFIFNNGYAIIKMRIEISRPNIPERIPQIGNGEEYENFNLRQADERKREPKGAY